VLRKGKGAKRKEGSAAPPLTRYQKRMKKENGVNKQLGGERGEGKQEGRKSILEKGGAPGILSTFAEGEGEKKERREERKVSY